MQFLDGVRKGYVPEPVFTHGFEGYITLFSSVGPVDVNHLKHHVVCSRDVEIELVSGCSCGLAVIRKQFGQCKVVNIDVNQLALEDVAVCIIGPVEIVQLGYALQQRYFADPVSICKFQGQVALGYVVGPVHKDAYHADVIGHRQVEMIEIIGSSLAVA